MHVGASAAFEAACHRWPGRTAVEDATGEAIGFAALFATVLAFAEQVQERGVRRGDLVAVDMADATAGHVLRLALLRLGTRQIEGRAETLKALYGLNPDWAFSDSPQTAGAGFDEDRYLRVDQGWIRAPRERLPVVGGGEMLLATTGTTGTPKLRLIGEEALVARWARSTAFRGAASGPAFVGYRPGSSPGFDQFMRALLAGCSVVQPRPTDQASLEAIDSLGVTDAFLAPFNFELFLDLATRLGLRPRALSRIVVGGGAILPAIAARAEAHFGCPVFNTYGSTETGSIAMVRVIEAEAGVVGVPHADMGLRFRDPEGAEADPGTGGEILVRPPAAAGVLSYPALTPIGDRDGWIATGDVGRLDAAGQLCLSGRVHEILNIGGNKRAPIWFEDIARGFPGVARLAAFGLPSGQGGDIVGLAVEAPDGFDLNGFAQFMIARLGPSYPIQIGLVDQIPVNAGGKLDRQAVRAAFLIAAEDGPAPETGNS